MSEPTWFEAGETVEVGRVLEEIERRVAAWEDYDPAAPSEIAARLRVEMLGDPAAGIGAEDCEILPHDYVIDHRIPILGPAHSVVRRLINDEIRRYLEPGLLRQSRLNRWFLQEIRRLEAENRRLRDRLAALDGQSGPDDQ